MSGNAAAVTIARDYLSHGTANCQSALPVFDGNIRKRPMAVANEGTSNAFVTCDADTINNGGVARYTEIVVLLINRAGVADVTVSCTAVDGFITATTFITKSSAPIPVGTPGLIQWIPTDNGGNNYRSPALNCNLPAGVDLSAIMFNYAEEVGL